MALHEAKIKLRANKSITAWAIARRENTIIIKLENRAEVQKVMAEKIREIDILFILGVLLGVYPNVSIIIPPILPVIRFGIEWRNRLPSPIIKPYTPLYSPLTDINMVEERIQGNASAGDNIDA